MNHDAATLAFYAREAAAYAARPRGSAHLALAAFLASLEPGCHILDLGCGGGQDAFEIKRAGYKVTAMDGSPELAAEAERRLGEPIRVKLFEELDDAGIFDAVWANASLLHVPKPALPGVIARILRALKPEGLFHASFKTGGPEGRDALGRYYNRPSKEELIAALPRPDWKIIEIAASDGRGYDGEVTGWLTVKARKVATRPLAKAGNQD